MYKYVYDGPVMRFDDCINYRWHAETCAVSVEKARSNMTYKYKMEHGYSPDSAIRLTGRIKMVDEYTSGQQLRMDNYI